MRKHILKEPKDRSYEPDGWTPQTMPIDLKTSQNMLTKNYEYNHIIWIKSEGKNLTG